MPPGPTKTGLVWLRHKDPIIRMVAADAYARSQLGKAALPQILPILNDDYAMIRMFGLFAIERILGRRLTEQEYTPMAHPTLRAKQVKALAR